jgi:hypothetical protein
MDEIIWTKLISWNIVLKDDISPDWYNTYKMFAIKIYQKDLTFLINHLNELTDLGKIISSCNYYNLIHNLLFLICVFSDDSSMLEFYFNKFRDIININHIETTNFNYNLIEAKYEITLNYLMHVLRKRTKSLSLVKYLIEECKIDMTFIDGFYELDCLHYAINEYDFKSKTSLKIVKYLVDECGMDILKFDRHDRHGKSYLMHACDGYGSDIKLIKYLVEEKKMDISQYLTLGIFLDGIFGRYGDYKIRTVDTKIMNNTYTIVMYIIDNVYISDIMGVNFLDHHIELKGFQKFIKYVKDYEKFNILLKKYLEFYLRKYFREIVKNGYNVNIKCLVKPDNNYDTRYYLNRIIKFLESIDPYLLNEENAKISGLDVSINQLKLSFNDFVKCVDEFKCGKYVYSCLKNELESIRKKNTQINNTSDSYDECDHSQKNMLESLFIHNGISYYGDKKIVYSSILLLKDIDLKSLDDTIIFEGKMPKYLVNIYLNAIIFKQFKIDEIEPEDIFEFIKFLDQYPSNDLSIDKLELDLVEYFEANNIHFNEIILDICKRYKFRYMYLHMHNKNKYNYTMGGYDEEDNK